MLESWEALAETSVGAFQIVCGLKNDFFILTKDCLFWKSNLDQISNVWQPLANQLYCEPRSVCVDYHDSNLVYVCCGNGIWKIDLITNERVFGKHPPTGRVRGGIRLNNDIFFLFDYDTAWKAKPEWKGIGFSTKYAQIQIDCVTINQRGTCIYAANRNFIYELSLTNNSITNLKYSFAVSFTPKTRFSFIKNIAVDESDRFLYVMDIDYSRFFALNLKTLVVKVLGSFETHNYGTFTLGRDGFMYAATGCLYRTRLPVTKLPWCVARVVWIGNMKNSSMECLLAQLPRDIMKEILLLCLDM